MDMPSKVQYLSERDALQAKIDAALGTRGLTPPGFATSGAAATFQHDNPFVYNIAGASYYKDGQATGIAIPAGTTLANATSDANFYLVSISAAGAFTVTEGTPVVAPGAIAIPAVPSGNCPVGLLHVEADSADFIPGTTLLNAAGITVKFMDLVGVSLASMGLLGAFDNWSEL